MQAAGKFFISFPTTARLTKDPSPGKRNPAAGRPDEIHACVVDDICAALGREKVSELLPIGAETAEQQAKGNAICA